LTSETAIISTVTLKAISGYRRGDAVARNGSANM
jgi:hypothetical protein